MWSFGDSEYCTADDGWSGWSRYVTMSLGSARHGERSPPTGAITTFTSAALRSAGPNSRLSRLRIVAGRARYNESVNINETRSGQAFKRQSRSFVVKLHRVISVRA